MHRRLREAFPEEQLLEVLPAVGTLIDLGGTKFCERMVLALARQSESDAGSRPSAARLNSLVKKESWLLQQSQVQALPHWHLETMLSATEGKSVQAQKTILKQFNSAYVQSESYAEAFETLKDSGLAPDIEISEDGLFLGDHFLEIN